MLIRGLLGVSDKKADLPADAPAVFKAIQCVAVFTIITGLASIGAWIAFDPGPREFSFSGPIAGSLVAMIGRIVFGIGAVITWLIAVLVAYAGVMALLGKKS